MNRIVIGMFFAAMIVSSDAILASKENKQLYTQYKNEMDRIYAQYKNKIDQILMKAKQARSKKISESYDFYIQAKRLIEEAQKQKLYHNDIEALKKIVYDNIKALPDNGDVSGLLVWFAPITEAWN